MIHFSTFFYVFYIFFLDIYIEKTEYFVSNLFNLSLWVKDNEIRVGQGVGAG